MNGGGSLHDDDNTISINRIKNQNQVSTTLPVTFQGRNSLQPEQDLLYDTQTNAFKSRRRTQGNAMLEPIPRKKGQFLRKGEGNGGSPTNFVLR